MSSKRTAVIELFKKGTRQCDISRLLGMPKQTVSDTVRRYRELGHSGDRPGRGRKRSVNTPSVRRKITKRIKRNPRVSMRKIAREIEVNRETVRRIAKDDLNLKPYKLRRVQLLTDEDEVKRLQRCRLLKQRAAEGRWETILFTDEKLFTVEQSYNPQNDRHWCSENPGSTSKVERRQCPESVMIWAGICATGKTPLVFVGKGVKINQEVYQRDILEAVVLPWARTHFGNSFWTFQQDSAPAHRAVLTQEWCKKNFPDFITSKEWPPYSPDLNPMDYSVWSILEARACAKPHKSTESLRRSLQREWDRLGVDELRPIAENFVTRLKLCIKARGGHFESN